MGSRRPTIVAQFVAVCIVGGSGFLLMTTALQGMTFVQVTWARIILGSAGLLLVVGLKRDIRVPRRIGTWAKIVVLAFTNMILPFFLLSWSQLRISSGIATVLMAATPLCATAVSVAAFRVETLRLLQAFGLVVGSAGIVVVVAPWQSVGKVDAAGAAACLTAAACIGFSFAFTRRFIDGHELPGRSLAFLVAFVAAIVMLFAAPWMELGTVQLSVNVILSISVLGVVGTGLGIMWSLTVTFAWGSARASAATLISPVIGIALGVLLLDESFQWYHFVGGALVIASIPFINSVVSESVRCGLRPAAQLPPVPAVPQAAPKTSS